MCVCAAEDVATATLLRLCHSRVESIESRLSRRELSASYVTTPVAVGETWTRPLASSILLLLLHPPPPISPPGRLRLFLPLCLSVSLSLSLASFLMFDLAASHGTALASQ